jgi:UDP-N-acetylglucosamine diphosphorylase/glucosamine-1-phosphate N-acetyltransferase
MPLCVFEDEETVHLRPLVNTRAVYDLRLGIRTLLETTRDAFGAPPTVLHARTPVAAVTAQEHDHPVNALDAGEAVLFVNGRFVAHASPVLDRLRRAADPGEPPRAFVQDGHLIAAWVPDVGAALAERVSSGALLTPSDFADGPNESVDGATLVHRLWHLLDTLPPALERDFAARTGPYHILDDIYSRSGATVHPSTVGVNPEQIFIEQGATVQPGAVLNAEHGPIFIDRDAQVMEQAVLRGPLYIGPKTKVKIGANLETCAIGRWCKVGGEVHDTVMHSLSNKSHTGFLGHSYLGRWCNLGADTNVSNLKNDYGDIALYNPATETFEPTGRQFVGCFMGDHSKTAINTMLNTGTLVGTFCNLYGADFPPRVLPSFTWGTPGNYTTYRLEKALRVAEAVMARRDTPFTAADRALLTHVFETTRDARTTAYAPA